MWTFCLVINLIAILANTAALWVATEFPLVAMHTACILLNTFCCVDALQNMENS